MTGQLDTPAPCSYCQEPTWRAVAWHRGVAPPPQQSSGKSSVAMRLLGQGLGVVRWEGTGHLLGRNDEQPRGLVIVADKRRHLGQASCPAPHSVGPPGAQDAASLVSYCAMTVSSAT
jgi:hypothetical protein